MKDILKFGQYVRPIAEAHSKDDTEREKALALKAEEWFDIYGVPDYSAETGEAVEELPFFEDLKAAERTGKDGKKILCSNLQDAHAIKVQAEEYLTATEGKNAPGRCYMRRCLNAVEGIIEYLEKLQQMLLFATFGEQGVVDESPQIAKSQIRNEEIEILYDARESLFKQADIKANIHFADFKDYINQLIQNGILSQGNNDSVRKLEAGFKSFLIGADTEDVKEFRPNDYLIVGNTKKFVLFIDKLQSKIKEDSRKYNFWNITQKWFATSKGKAFKENSLKTICARAKKEELNSKDRSLDNLVNDLLKIIDK